MDKIEAIYPLSPVQHGMLFHSLYAPETGVYVEQLSCTLRGNLDVDAFERAWQHALDRHPVLRTAFVWAKVPRPLQLVHATAKLPFAVHDWRALAAGERERRLHDTIDQDHRRGFELTRPPLLRLLLFRVTEDESRLVWTHHHLILDGWSVPLVLEEVFADYDALRNHREFQAPPRRPYGDYIAWLKQKDISEAEVFWRQVLSRFTTPTSLGIERTRGARRGGTAPPQEVRAEIAVATTEGLQALARRHHLTLNTVIQGAWAVLLSRYGGEDDVVFGATVSGRPTELEGVDAMIGLFINTLPVRVRVSPEARLIPWLETLQAQQAEMRRFEHTPLSELQRWSDVPKGSPLFESIVVFENYPMDRTLGVGRAGLTFDGLSLAEKTNYPLTLTTTPGPPLVFHVSYDSERFDAKSISGVLANLEALLSEMTVDPTRPLGALRLPGDLTLVRPPGQTAGIAEDVAASPPVHRRFERWAKQAPDAVAVVFEGQRLSYRELDERADRLARLLRRRGVGPEVRVGLYVDRSIGTVVGMLGILKAGGAYVPLDPAHPRERLAFVIADSGVSVVLSERQLVGSLPCESAMLLCIEDDAGVFVEAAPESPATEIDADQLVYVIYTSGSTGRPKGVAVTHRNVARLFDATRAWFDPGPGDVWTLFHSHAFDFSVWELWGALCHGGTVVVVPHWVSRSPEAFYALLEKERVSFLSQTPSAFHQLVQEVESKPKRDLALRFIVFGGEALDVRALASWFERFGDRSPRIVNMYGITETTVHVTYRPLTAADVADFPKSPIGVPIPDLDVYILDRHLRPVPRGVPGEIFVAGAGVARGYLERPDLTAERFVPDPFSSTPGARMYRSGDLAREIERDLEFVGRSDTQVKVRGYRIELGEIESVLMGHAGVVEAVVVAREERVGEKRLAAYVVMREGIEVASLREQVKARLPEYMVPSWFVRMERLPLTPNGKVDRRALPAPERGGMEGERYVAPRTELEGTLAGIWSEVLGVERVGVEDNFFELGGDSILSIQVVSRAGGKGIRITPRQVFEHQTIAALAGVASLAEEGVAAEQGRVEGEVPLTAIQRWFLEEGYEGKDHWNQAVLLEVDEGVDVDRLEQAVRRAGEHHDALRLRYEREGEEWRQRYAEEGEEIGWDRRDLSGAEEVGEAIARAASEVHGSLDLGRGPLARAVYLGLGRGRGGRLLMVMHHMVVDGVSWRIVLEDVVRGYEQLGTLGRLELPAKTTSFKAWSERVREYVRGGGVDSELAYWSRGGWEGLGQVPRDHAGGSNTEGTSETVTVRLGDEETRKLLQEVPAAYRTEINDVLVTGLVEGLRRWTGRERWVIDLEGHGREEWFEGMDLSRTVGWFTTVYPVALGVGVVWSAGEALKGVKESLRGVPRRGMGYGLLRYVRGGEAEDRLRGGEGAEVSFNYLGQLDRVLGGAGWLRWAAEESGTTRAPEARRSHVLDVNAQVVGGCLETEWTYGTQLHRRDTIEQVAGQMQEALRELIAHCTSPGAGGYTPSDFPDVELDAAQLAKVLKKVGQPGKGSAR